VKVIELLKDSSKALLIGMGGGGDAVSTLYVKEFFSHFDVECILGGVVWERFRRDPKPGPRSIEEIRGAEKINDCLAWLDGDERIENTVPITSKISELASRVVGVDITKGVKKLRESLYQFVRNEEIDIIVGVDAGGDVLAKGDEVNLVSPLADAIMLAAIKDLHSLVAVVGFGSDGELSRSDIEARLSELNSAVIGVSIIGSDVAEQLKDFVYSVETEASRIPLAASLGYHGSYNFWGEFEIHVGFLNSLIFYIDAKHLYDSSPLAKAVSDAESIEEASRKLNEMGIKTEYDLEVELAKKLTQGKTGKDYEK
jgi:hypothetical protein